MSTEKKSLSEYKNAIILGVIAFILLNLSIIANLAFKEKQINYGGYGIPQGQFYELIYLLTTMLGLISFIGAFILFLTVNQKYDDLK